MRLSTKLSGIVAVGGVAALGAGLISSGGIGAVFTDLATANASINVGRMSCQLATDDPAHVTISTTNSSNDTATVKLDQITSSLPGESMAGVYVKNTGDTPLVASWSRPTTSVELPFKAPTPDQVTVAAGQTSAAPSPVGFKWDELGNDNEAKTVSATFQINCYDTLMPPVGAGFTLLGHDGGYSTWNGIGVKAVLGHTGSVDIWPAGGIFIDVTSDQNLPPEVPKFSFVDDTDGHSDPYLAIKLYNTAGDYKYLNSANGTNGQLWNFPAVGTASAVQFGTWDQAVAAATAAGYTTVGKAWVQLANSVPGGSPFDQSGTFTCVNYSGTPVFGNC